MGDAKDTSGYRQGGEGDGKQDDDPASQNPTGRKRKSSAGQRRKKDRKLFGGTPWAKKKDDGKK
ncbi:hypothetical protein SEA_ARACELI_2 [Streptomyces phage Araceli]|nr:hypothetical protein SEA_HENOCCUS_2 [Streptomyces phage Henoccus]AWY07322.1 hypothetical protein SEA_JACKIEB_2 [Streptomyces phage JackieB]QFG07816.1 hypothetical protein SEA_ARACELI_2 [Streptomyces phage Araceli]